MNPNKKSLVVNNGWILCPSKSFPGKFYYFNGQTGEAVWSLTDNEKNALKKDNRGNIQKINNTFHGYPEPATPPNHSPEAIPKVWPNTSTNIWPNCKTPFQNRNFVQHTPMFGQPARFDTNLDRFMPMPNIVWTPIQLPTPNWRFMAPDWRPTADQVTQTSQIERDLHVHTSGIPLSQRFVNYETPTLSFDKENKILKNNSKTPDKNESKMQLENDGTLTNNTEIVNLEQDYTNVGPSKNIGKSTLIPHRIEFSDEDQSETDFCTENQNLMHCNKVNNTKSDDLGEVKDISKLDSSDLRFLLVAKRKQAVKQPLEVKKAKLNEPVLPSRKKITFDLTNEHYSDASEDNEICISAKTPIKTYNMESQEQAIENNINSDISKEKASILTTPRNQLNLQPILKQDNNKSTNNIIKESIINDPIKEKASIPLLKETHQIKETISKNTRYEIVSHTYPEINKETNKGHLKESTSIPIKESTNQNVRYEEIIYQPIKETSNEILLKELNTKMKETEKIKEFTTNNMQMKEQASHDLLLKETSIRKVDTKLTQIKEKGLLKEPSLFSDKEIWYLVADVNVLLDNYEIIEEILKSDEKSRLLIPGSVRSDIEALCIGDCRGQQRVLIARQMSRRMAGPYKQYIVEPRSQDSDNITNSYDNILNCCMKAIKDKYYVILLTNDENLQSKANSLNIKCCKPQEFTNGVAIQPKPYTDLKKIKVILNNRMEEENNIFIQNKISDLFSKREKDLVGKETGKNCDFLINITKPKLNKCMESSEISNRVQELHLKETNNDFEKLPNSHKNPKSLFNNNQNTFFQNFQHNLQKTNNQKPNSIISKYFQNDNDSFVKLFDSTKPSISTQNISQRIDDKSQNIQETRINTAARNRVEKILNVLNPKTSKINQNQEQIFKIPKLLPIRRPIKTTPKDRLETTDQVLNFKMSPALKGSLNKFCVKNNNMSEKLRNRMDEWICCFTQIMEELLSEILQKNSEHMQEINVSCTNIHKSLTCIKMLYDDAKLREIVECLVELLVANSCDKGKLKLDTKPEDFMKIIGCSFLLAQTLKSILPTCTVLQDIESNLDTLLYHIESESVDPDPELLRPSAVCRSEVNDVNKGTRQNFSKEPSYVIDYLKKHFKCWADLEPNKNENNSNSKNGQNEDLKIVRMFGKNLSMVKIDNNKSISYSKPTENASKADETKVMRLVENDQPTEMINSQNTGQILGKLLMKPQKLFCTETDNNKRQNDNYMEIAQPEMSNFDKNNEDHTFDEAGPKMISNMKLIDQYEERVKNKEPLDLDLLDYSEMNNSIDDFSDKTGDNISFRFNDNENDGSNNGFFKTPNNVMQFDDSYARVSDNYASVNENYASRNDTQEKGNDIENFDSISISKIYGSRNNTYANVNYATVALTDDKYANCERNYANTREDSTADSGFENESTQAHTLVKVFLKQLSKTFKDIYGFITSFVKEIRGKPMCEERKNILHIKASRCLQEMVAVIHQLKSIIRRESHENTVLKSLLLSAGIEATTDKRITRYRQIIIKCLEQAQTLESALRVIVCITIGDIDAISNNADSISSSIRYINIFE
ncbi:uncharacterized protein LOC142984724 [Anticarsia gemmatalis]|uniref:uncharacterized protein LOC142984724 n=1 Tax=Anticarsia gemmatalis TaxID=129554 RepID=UPI003F7619CB